MTKWPKGPNRSKTYSKGWNQSRKFDRGSPHQKQQLCQQWPDRSYPVFLEIKTKEAKLKFQMDVLTNYLCTQGICIDHISFISSLKIMKKCVVQRKWKGLQFMCWEHVSLIKYPWVKNYLPYKHHTAQVKLSVPGFLI